jgi:hypothetical protein
MEVLQLPNSKTETQIMVVKDGKMFSPFEMGLLFDIFTHFGLVILVISLQIVCTDIPTDN